jgi:hypothetical protein
MMTTNSAPTMAQSATSCDQNVVSRAVPHLTREGVPSREPLLTCGFFRRREGDSNPRGVAPYPLSRRAH